MSDNDENPVRSDSVVKDAPAESGATDTTAADAEATRIFATDATDATDAINAAMLEPHDRPRTRWAAIVWGLIIAGIAGTTLAIVSSPERRLAVSDWTATLTPGSFWILSVLVVGLLILVLAVLALIRRAQRRQREA